MGDGVWLPAIIEAPSVNPIGYEVKYAGGTTAVVGTYTIRRCVLQVNDSVEVYGGKDEGWIPGSILECPKDTAGFKVLFGMICRSDLTCRICRVVSDVSYLTYLTPSLRHVIIQCMRLVD